MQKIYILILFLLTALSAGAQIQKDSIGTDTADSERARGGQVFKRARRDPSPTSQPNEPMEPYRQATEAYEQGKFELSDSILLSCVDRLKGEERIGAYRMLALSSLMQENQPAAEQYATNLLALDPFYSAYGDSPRFTDLLARLKKGNSTITTASRMAESLEEVPVPVTLITEEMIKATGARTLSEILLLYVPGISQIGEVEDNLAMRGVYGLSQETVLVMLDGHRLNSESTNAYILDYRNGLDKIKQIEVLRGPASSLYGNVALTAVVNIITKKGSELEGAQASVLTGSHHTFGGTLLYGNGNLRSDIMAWATVYGSRGEKRVENGLTHYVGGYNDKPAFDIGAKIRWGDLNIEVTAQHAKATPYYNLLEMPTSYSYDSYGKQTGEKPGLSRTNTRIDLEYTKDWGPVSLSLSGFGGVERLQLYNVLGDSIDYNVAAALLSAIGFSTQLEPITQGCWQSIGWEMYSFGGSVSATVPYKWHQMSGSLVGGLQYETFSLSYSNFTLGSDYDQPLYYKNSIMDVGQEQTLSAYLQLKHRFTNHLIFNGGLRFDHKIRFSDDQINTLSPRFSLIWLPNKTFSLKAGYSHSFVDAPYFYRASQTTLFSGGKDLKPEKMDAFQLGANWNFEPIHLKYEVNAFYNSVRDLIYYAGSSTSSGMQGEAGVTTFANAGKINMGGLENTLQYSGDKVFANLNFTYQYPFAVENFASTYHHLSNVPRFLLNLTSTQKVLSVQNAGSLWVRENLHAQGCFEVLDNNILKKFQYGSQLFTQHQSAVAVVGAGAEWRFAGNRISLSVDGYNLLNTRYRIGGNVEEGVPNQGRSLLARLQVKF